MVPIFEPPTVVLGAGSLAAPGAGGNGDEAVFVVWAQTGAATRIAIAAKEHTSLNFMGLLDSLENAPVQISDFDHSATCFRMRQEPIQNVSLSPAVAHTTSATGSPGVWIAFLL